MISRKIKDYPRFPPFINSFTHSGAARGVMTYGFIIFNITSYDSLTKVRGGGRG